MTKSSINSGFIGDFKLGDNINYNLEILKHLYESENKILNKPKSILIISIIEAILYDFYFKARFYYLEGIKNVHWEIIDYIRGKSIDKFEQYIRIAQKKELFGVKSEPIYKNLDLLRKLRNRIHIQNANNHLEPNDSKAFSCDRRELAESTLLLMLRYMSEKHDRGHNFVKNFKIPWKTRAQSDFS